MLCFAQVTRRYNFGNIKQSDLNAVKKESEAGSGALAVPV